MRDPLRQTHYERPITTDPLRQTYWAMPLT